MKDVGKMLGRKLLRIGDELEQWGGELEGGCLEPLCYMEDKGDFFLVSADLPLVDKKDVQVYLTDDALEISARMKKTCTFRALGAIESHFEFQSFHKAVSLPPGTDTEKARARFAKGVLEIQLPKKSHKRQIKVE
jgi:HSP20 family protein